MLLCFDSVVLRRLLEEVFLLGWT